MKKIVLIDDDKLIALSWQMRAKKAAVDLSVFQTVDDFLKSELPAKDTLIYVDSSLGNNIKGEIESRKIADLGYSEIYLATGYEASSFDLAQSPWIKGIISKTPPF